MHNMFVKDIRTLSPHNCRPEGTTVSSGRLVRIVGRHKPTFYNIQSLGEFYV